MKSSSIPLRYGIVLSVTLILYFLILSLFNLHTYVWFSFVNAVLTGGGIFLSIRDYKRKTDKFDYPRGISAGLKTGIAATLIFTLFFAIYATYINPGFIDLLVESWNMLPDSKRAFAQVIFVVGLMGFVSTFILTLVCMQLFKDSWNTHEKESN